MSHNLKIIWSETAKSTYIDILQAIIDKWSMKEAEAFDQQVEKLLTNLRKHKFLCPVSEHFVGIRRCVITKQTSLTYQITESSIDILFFYDNRSSLQL